MLKNKSQLSVEYLILTGFIIGIISVVLVIFLKVFASGSAQDAINAQKINDLGDDIVKKAKQVFYLGLYSKQNVEYDIPDNVEFMFILELTKSTGEKFYYFGIHAKDKEIKKHYFLSDVPIASDGTLVDVDEDDLSSLIPECSTATCKFYNFKGNLINPGKKVFKIETRLYGAEPKVAIVPSTY